MCFYGFSDRWCDFLYSSSLGLILKTYIFCMGGARVIVRVKTRWRPGFGPIEVHKRQTIRMTKLINSLTAKCSARCISVSQIFRTFDWSQSWFSLSFFSRLFQCPFGSPRVISLCKKPMFSRLNRGGESSRSLCVDKTVRLLPFP